MGKDLERRLEDIRIMQDLDEALDAEFIHKIKADWRKMARRRKFKKSLLGRIVNVFKPFKN